MSGFELNKIAAGILVAGLVMMIAGKLAGLVYKPEEAEKRGYEVEVAEVDAGGAVVEKQAVDLTPLLAVATLDKGAKVAKKCVACHSFDKGGPNKVGPGLYGILGDGAARKADFNYSDALQAYGKGWDYDNMAAFLKNPKGYIRGTKMAFAGLRKPGDIAAILVYMRAQADSELPLPTAPIELK